MSEEQSLEERLRIRAKIRREIPHRKSVQEGKPDRIADLLDEAADEIDLLRETLIICQAKKNNAERHLRFLKQFINKIIL